MGERVFGFRGGPRTNWAHVYDVASACIFSATQNQCWDTTMNVCDSVALGFGDVITMYLEAAGLEVTRQIPLPPPNIMKVFRPLVEIPGAVEAASKLASSYWGALKEQRRLETAQGELVDSLVVKVDREATPYLYNDMIFSNKRILSKGWTPHFEHPLQGIKQTMRWYKNKGWVW